MSLKVFRMACDIWKGFKAVGTVREKISRRKEMTDQRWGPEGGGSQVSRPIHLAIYQINWHISYVISLSFRWLLWKGSKNKLSYPADKRQCFLFVTSYHHEEVTMVSDWNIRDSATLIVHLWSWCYKFSITHRILIFLGEVLFARVSLCKATLIGWEYILTKYIM